MIEAWLPSISDVGMISRHHPIPQLVNAYIATGITPSGDVLYTCICVSHAIDLTISKYETLKQVFVNVS